MTSLTSIHIASLTFNTTRIKHIKLPYYSSHPIKTSPPFFTPKPISIRPNSVSETPVSLPVDDDQEVDDDPTAELSYLDPETDPETVTEWELDFCSRPILDIRGKKIWELVACDSSLSLQYTKYFPNNVINSVTLKDAIVSICDELDVPIPDKIRFFRSQMQTIITRACKELGIKPIPSKRVNIFSDVKKELETLEKSFAFGATLDLDLLGIEIDDNTLIPGLAVASSRARPLAAWMNGLEVCSVEADLARANLVLSVGISTRYVYASYKKSPVTTSEAEAWEAAKKISGGLHFLAIQDSLDSDDCVGFWLLLDLPPSPV
ncbi:hypothetical protein M8C21_019681 [Ambrosia artemisiifolia]|uniref:Protein TAB2 homolog, chloroplastic n=1 Tax=Ambrosia artemisiifolia TaxID=4212 RepID=A0AAD5BXL2_AMBAR|nr:hypothetical protein M8C21_019681 [Ambrosia artemisiifolia]